MSGYKIEVFRVEDYHGEKSVREGVEHYGSQNAILSHDHKGVDESNLPDYHDREVQRIVRKIDYRLPPVLALLYLLSFLDRSNIGNAKIAGMTKDLDMTGNQYNIALTVFFFPYALFMVPSNMVLKKVRPCTWLAILMMTWGTVMTMHGLVKTYGQLCACRALLGLFESGFTPAATYLLTCWYCRYELQTRVALFFSSATLAGAFSGILAYFITKMDGIGGQEGWRWIFYLEGIATVLVGCSIYFIMPNSAATAPWLTPSEKEIIRRRLEEDSGTKEGHVSNDDPFTIKAIVSTLSDWKIWLWGVAVCGQSIPFYAFTFFCPTIIKELGYKSWQAQLLTVPVYGVACIATIIVALWADRRQTRWKFIAIPYSISAVGFVAMLSIPHPRLPGLTYGFLFLIPLGLSSGLTALLAWIGNNLSPSWRRAIGTAFVPMLANLGGAIGSNIYLEEEAPRYWLGFGFSLGVQIASIVSVIIMKTALTKINRKRDAMDVVEIREKYSEEDLLRMGDRSPLYRYVI